MNPSRPHDYWVPRLCAVLFLTAPTVAYADPPDVGSSVAFRTTRSGTETTGALIRYQTVFSRIVGDVPVTGCTSSCQQFLAVGSYYIWAERDGLPTSDTNARFDVVERTVPIAITETR